MVTDATALGTILSGLNDQVDDLLSIDFANIQMVRQDESSWKGLDHAEREDGFTEWTDSNTSMSCSRQRITQDMQAVLKLETGLLKFMMIHGI